MRATCFFRPCMLLGLVFLTVVLPSTTLANTTTCESAETIPEGYKTVANGLVSATSSFREVVHAQQVVYVEIENQNVIPGPVALRIRGSKRLDGNGARETLCATDLSVLPKTTAVFKHAVFGKRIEYEVDAQLKAGADAGLLTVKVFVLKP